MSIQLSLFDAPIRAEIPLEEFFEAYYESSRTMGNFYSALTRFNNLSKCKVIQSSDKVEFLCCMNSYLGFMRHYSSYRYRVRIVSRLLAQWWACVATTNQCQKFIISEYDGYTPII